MNKQVRYSLEVRERADQLVYENQGDYVWFSVVGDGIDSSKDRLFTVIFLTGQQTKLIDNF